MQIHGLQKLTLLDYPGLVACTVFLGGCNFRCPFCHNWDLVTGDTPALMDERELLAFLQKRQGLLDGVCITGGEPLLRPSLPALLGAIRALGYRVKLDTNGAQPQQLQRLIDEGLVDYVAMDIKNSPLRYAETIGLPTFDLTPVQESVRLLLTGRVEYEFRTTVVHPLHDADSFRAIAHWLSGAQHYYLQCFTDRDTVPTAGLSAPTEAELTRYAAIVRRKVPNTSIRGL